MEQKPPSRVDLLRGTLDLLILRTLLPGPSHGHAIAKHIQRTSEELLQVETGSLYPALYRLEARAWIAASWELSDKGKRARYYRITPKGRKQLAAEQSKWDAFVRAMGLLLKPAPIAGMRTHHDLLLCFLFRKVQWWLQRRHKEEELREELQFHLAEEKDERQADGLSADEATWAARRDLGNATLLREDARTLWSWMLLEQLAQDVRYGLRGMFKNRMFTGLAALSLALGIGANTAIYSFMDSILLRSLPVADPASLVVVKWRSRPVNRANGDEFVLHSINGSTYRDGSGVTAAIFPFPAFEHLYEASAPVLSSLFAHKPAGNVNVIVKGEAALVAGEYVSGDFFRGLAVVPSAGRLIQGDDDLAGAAPVAVVSAGYGQRRFGDAASAVGQALLVNNVPFTVVGVVPPEFFGVDPACGSAHLSPHAHQPSGPT